MSIIVSVRAAISFVIMDGSSITILNNQELLILKKNSTEIKYRVFQIYGQKYIKLMNPPFVPDRWSEVYASNIPRSMTITKIFWFFLQCGEIYQLRLMMDFSGSNRGHCFVHYKEVEDSRAAICRLHGEEIQEGYKIIVKLSLNNNQLIIKNIPAFIPENCIKEELQRAVGEGLVEVTMRPSRISSRNYCFCTFRDHQFAVKAHKKVWPYVTIAGHAVDVHWAVPELLRYTVNLYFANFPEDLTKDELFVILKNRINIKSLVQFRIEGSVGFIMFTNRMYLVLGESSLKDLVIRGYKIKFSKNPFSGDRDVTNVQKGHSNVKYCPRCNYVHNPNTIGRTGSSWCFAINYEASINRVQQINTFSYSVTVNQTYTTN